MFLLYDGQTTQDDRRWLVEFPLHLHISACAIFSLAFIALFSCDTFHSTCPPLSYPPSASPYAACLSEHAPCGCRHVPGSPHWHLSCFFIHSPGLAPGVQHDLPPCSLCLYHTHTSKRLDVKRLARLHSAYCAHEQRTAAEPA